MERSFFLKILPAVAWCSFAGTPTKAQTFHSLYSFSGKNGSSPIDVSAIGKDGALYGTTSTGGDFGYGTIFKFDPAAKVLTTLYSFNGVKGRYPVGRVLLRGNDSLVGVTSYGGGSTACSEGCGEIYRFSLKTSKLHLLHVFNNQDGSAPNGGLAYDKFENIYGTTSSGPNYTYATNCGIVFKLHLNTRQFTTLHNFQGGDGCHPQAGMVFGKSGLLYGTTSYAGPQQAGNVFSIDPSGAPFAVLHTFDDADGEMPLGRLTLNAKGTIYGTTYYGGHNNGVSFSLDSQSLDYKITHYFDGENETPAGRLIFGKGHLLYGTAQTAYNSFGTVFKLDPRTNDLMILHAFNDPDGRYPGNEITFGHDGTIYGVTFQGGTYNMGTIFSIEP